MKRIFLLSILTIFFYACDSTPAGNKSIKEKTYDSHGHGEDTHATGSVEASSQGLSKENFKLQWTAFKTPAKVGVNGTFETFTYTSKSKANDLPEALEGSSFTIDKSTVFSGDATRDSKLVSFFFSNLDGDITGNFGTPKDGVIPITMTLNGKTVTKDFKFSQSEDNAVLSGSIDMISDFGAQTAFDAIHKACELLHEGKTWTEVDLTLNISK